MSRKRPIAAANRRAQFHPATRRTQHPAIQVAGIWVFAYLDHDAGLRVSVHLDQTEPWVLNADGTVPITVSIEGTDVYDA